MEAPKEPSAQENTKPEVAPVELQEVKEPTQEELAASLYNDLAPAPLLSAIANASEKDLEKAEKALENFGYSFPIKGLLNSYKELHVKQTAAAKVIVGLAIQTGKATQFVNAVTEQQAKMQEEYNKKLEAMKTLGIQPDQMQQAAPKQGMDLSAIGQFLPQIMQAFSQPAQPTAPTGINFAEIGAKFMQQALDNAMNPQPTALEKIGEMVIAQAVPKIAANIAAKA